MLTDLLERLKAGKDKIFYKINGDSITYYECYLQVSKLATNLKKQGTAPVIVYGHKSIDQVVAILSCVVAHRCYVPIDLCTPLFRIENIIEKSKATLMIKACELEESKIECLTINEINCKYGDLKEKPACNNRFAYIIFTSGSTGESKGVPITYDNLNHFIEWITQVEEFADCHEAIVLSQASFSFDLSVMDLYFSIYKCLTIVGVDLETKEDLPKLYSILSEEAISFLIVTPTFVKMLFLDSCFNAVNFPDLRYMFFCGECLEVETAKKIRERFFDVMVVNAYGPTEATCCVSLLKITEEMLKEKYLPVGRIETSAVDVEVVTDEIVLKGDSVFEGYLDTDSDSCYREEGKNCYKTGDIGYVDQGYLYCCGRGDSQIKYMGYRIELGDIENNLLKLPGIREAVVVAKYKKDSTIVKLVKAFVTVDLLIDEEEIKRELVKIVPCYMVPKRIVILDSMPVNSNGKYDRKKLSEL